MAAFSFGQTGASKVFGFGTPASQPAFGSFGAASTPAPAFGAATPPATPGFGFGAAATPATTGFGFGAAAPATTPASLFGSTATPAFGQTSPSLFGAASTPAFGAAAPASTGFAGFGAPGAFPSPAGASAASPSAGIFGSLSSPFGAPAPASQPAGMFGATGQMAPAAFSSGVTPDAAVREMNEIRSAYTPSSATYKFQHLFLNVVEDPAHRVKPANVDEIRWRQVLAQAGGPNNPDKLWPVLAVGFKDLIARAAAQQQAIEENQQRLRSLSELSHRMSRQHTVELKGRTADVQKRHIDLSHRLLHVTRLLDALESRLASSLGYRGDLSRSKEQQLSRNLTAVEAGMAPGSSSSLQRRLETVAVSARLRAGGPGNASASGSVQLDPKSLQQLFAVLKEHAEGVKQLQEVLKRDQLDLQIMRQSA